MKRRQNKGSDPEEKHADELAERIDQWFWRTVAMVMTGMALGVAIAAIIVIFLISFIMFLEVHG